jgi:tetratricopeptide (TPR) repeat protein
VSLVAKRLSRGVTPKDDLDLTRPEEIQAWRRKRLLLVALALAVALGIGVYFAAPRVGRAVKAWQARRLAHQALALVEQKQWNEASAKAGDAYALSPAEPEASRAIARVLSRTGQSTAALQWWNRVAAQNRLTIEDRRDFVGAALAAGELTTASRQIDALLAQKGGPAPIDILFAGQLAARQKNPLLASDYADRVMADKRAKSYDILSAVTLVVSITTRESLPHINAWKRIEDIARDAENPASLDALMFLATQQAQAPRSVIPSEARLSLGPDDGANQQAPISSPLNEEASLSLAPSTASSKSPATMGLMEIADRLEKHPKTRAYYKLVALQLRARQNPALAGQYVTDAVNNFGGGDDETLAALTGWLNSFGRAAKTLELVPLDRAVRSKELFLRHIEALEALDRWDQVKDTFMSERFPIDPVLQHMYLATARSHLGEATAATNEWHRALEAADNPDKLLGVAAYAEQNGAEDTADAAYAQIIRLSPKSRAAYEGRIRLAEKAGRTATAQTLAAEIVKLWPDDAEARNENAYLQLLLGATDGAAEAAEREAQVLVGQEPWNWSARATLGLARLRLGKKEEALAVFRDVRATGSEPPGALAVRAAILALNGYTEGARGDAWNLGAEYLLPEERALIAPLLAD